MEGRETVVRGVALGMAACLALAAGVAGQEVDRDLTLARQQIAIMESVLESAVANGAENLVRQVRAVMPDMLMLTGAPRARGFRLDGYGVFFDVDVPEMRRSMTWTLRTLIDESGLAANALAELRSTLEVITDPQVRAEAERAIQRIERQVGPPVDERPGLSTATASGSAEAATPGLPPGIDPLLVENPSAAYTKEVRAALIDAMLQTSGSLEVGPDEWLTVAARDNYSGQPFVPDSADLPTLVLRVRGSDLAAFRAGRITLDEGRGRVQTREQ